MEAGTTGQAGDGHADVGGVVEQDRRGVGVLADLLAQRRHRAVHGAGGEADGDLAVVADPGRDGISGGALGEEHDLDGDVAALPHEFLDQPGQLRDEGVVGLDLGAGALALVEEGVGLIDHHHDQRPGWGWAEMPGVGHPEDLGDGTLTVDHQPVDLAEHVADGGEVVLGGQPGSGEQVVVVGAALAVDEHELDGWGGGELAEEVGDEHGLAEPGQPANHRPGDLGQPDHDQAAVVGPAQPPGGQAGRRSAWQVDLGRGQQRVTVQPA
jgi:hypothetical protein